MDPSLRFCEWFLAEARGLRDLSLDAASDEIVNELKKVDSRLALELCDGADGVREMVLTATGNPDLFDRVRRLKDGLGVLPLWLFTALKPPRGFDFVLKVPEGGRLDASSLFFEPLNSNQEPPELGIRVYLAPEIAALDDAEYLLRIAVQAGIGEEAASQISHFEAAPISDALDDALPLSTLGEYVEWHSRRHPKH